MISVSPDKFYILRDIADEVEAEVSIPAYAELEGRDYVLVYMEDSFPDDENEAEEPDEDGVCILALTEEETPGSLFELRDEEGSVLAYAEEPETTVTDRITQILLSNLD